MARNISIDGGLLLKAIIVFKSVLLFVLKLRICVGVRHEQARDVLLVSQGAAWQVVPGKESELPWKIFYTIRAFWCRKDHPV